MATKRKSRGEPSISCIDVFCGVGGLTHGLARAGIRVKAGIDLDPDCRFPFEQNNEAEFLERDVRKVSGAEINRLFGDDCSFTLLAGCAPCQPFSTYSQSSRRQRAEGNWELVREFGRLARLARPDLITMENVPQLADHDVFAELLETLSGYNVWWDRVQCADFGVPQTRTRLVLLASRLGAIELKRPSAAVRKKATVRAAIGALPAIGAGAADHDDPMHAASGLSKINLRRIQSSLPGGTWRDWDDGLVADCHKRSTGKTYPSVYGRMEWDAPAPTITTQCFGFGNGRFGHPEQDRAITLREAAILQTFPKSYRFLPSGEKPRFSVMGRHIGNAVPVRIGETIGKALVSHVATVGA